MMDWGAYASRVLVVASSRRRTLFIQKFAKAEHLRQTRLRIIELRRVERLRRAKETGALPRISLQAPAQILIHLPSHSRERLNIYATVLDYSCCFTKFPFGSTSNRDSLPLALTNTS